MGIVSPPSERMSGSPGYFPSSQAVIDLDAFEERRSKERLNDSLQALLLRRDGVAIGPCSCENYSESGVLLKAPVGYGLAVGQRYGVILRNEETGQPLVECQEDGHYATVVRTKISAKEHGGAVSVGMRFDNPLFL